jgi:hypothetical protein
LPLLGKVQSENEVATKSGYEGILYYGTAGSTAATQVVNCEDLNYDTDLEKVETTTRGDGATLPKKSEKPVAIGATITWGMLMKTGDATLTALIAAARTGANVALRTKAHSTGTGFDGDCTVTVTHEMTLKGQSKFNFTATPNDELRAWSPNA